ncbi:MAG: hypothetical protein P8M78_01995 [Myxococcota bacterium]|nr:hypothetical protein [Myxococcota bacterium]
MKKESQSPGQVSKAAFRERVPELREQLLEAQFDLRARADSALLLVVAGPDPQSQAALGHRLAEWLDMRFVETRVFDAPKKHERSMPWLWRYWRSLPAKGTTGLFYGSWYNDALSSTVGEGFGEAYLENQLRRINALERMLSLESIRILKVWLAPDQDEASVDKTLGRAGRWRCFGSGGVVWNAAIEQMLTMTSTGHAPWVRIDGAQPRSRDLRVGEMILKVMEQEQDGAADATGVASPVLEKGTSSSRFNFDSQAPLDSEAYEAALKKQQRRLFKRIASSAFKKRGLLLIFEGADAAGKGGVIRRISEALDPRSFQVHPYSAPNVYERLYPYLWRFWVNLPAPGRVGIFDRSYYGRVLVERVEAFADSAEWGRGYTEIVSFERQLMHSGIIVQKFWLSISKEEQSLRFEARRNTPWKRHKITDEDWRNRERWEEYQDAASEMIDRTHSSDAPWHIVDSEDKKTARIEVLKILNRELGRRLKR